MPYADREKRLAYHKKYNKENYQKYYIENREKLLIKGEKWRNLNPGKSATKVRENRLKTKQEVMLAYGGKCAICGEQHIECLTIDHSNNDGAEFRINAGYVRRGNKEDKGNKKQDSFTGVKFYAWLKKNDFPKNLGLRVLCWNCNCSIGAYGYSPYEKD